MTHRIYRMRFTEDGKLSDGDDDADDAADTAAADEEQEGGRNQNHF